MAKPPADTKRFNEEETARRRAAAIKRAPNTSPKSNKELVGKQGRSMKIPETYRGIEYSVAREASGRWVWKLHPKPERGWPITSGKEQGNHESAIEAAHRAIDRLLKSGN